MQTRFKFTGEVMLPKADSKRPFARKMKGKKDKTKNMISLNFGIKESQNNMGFVEAFGMERDVVKTMDADNEKIEFDWDDRFDKEMVDQVASYRKYIVDLGEEFGGRKEFVEGYDALLYLEENLHKYKGKLCVTGQMEKEPYQGKYFDKFKFQNVYAVSDDIKSRLLVTTDIFYDKSCVDKTDYKTEKKIYVDGYIQQYISKDEGTMFIPQRFVFDASKYKEDNERHQKLLKYKLGYVDNTNKKMHHLLWEVVMLNGAEEVDFDESQLTKAQKEQLDLGVRTLDDFKPKGSMYGDRVMEYRLFEPKLEGDFDEGFVDAELTAKEFEEKIYQMPVDEDIDEVASKAKGKDADTEDDEPPFDKDADTSVGDDDLF